MTGPDDRCPCGTGDVYGACCGRFHPRAGSAPDRAPTAEALMRSRYSAFVVGDEAHLLATWAPEERPDRVDLTDGVRWLRLDVLGTTGGGPFDDTGTVEFEARFRLDGRRETQHENSRFERRNGTWFYVGAV